MQFRAPPPPQVSGVRPASRPSRSDRDCPPDTAGDRCLWHAGGTAGDNDDRSQLVTTGFQLVRRVRPILGLLPLSTRGTATASSAAGWLLRRPLMTLKVQRMAWTCPLCGSSGRRNREDALPSWVLRYAESSRVEPSMSVNSSVTVPLGSSDISAPELIAISVSDQPRWELRSPSLGPSRALRPRSSCQQTRRPPPRGASGPSRTRAADPEQAFHALPAGSTGSLRTGPPRGSGPRRLRRQSDADHTATQSSGMWRDGGPRQERARDPPLPHWSPSPVSCTDCWSAKQAADSWFDHPISNRDHAQTAGRPAPPCRSILERPG
jgi:hypothetical protein